ncbi:MAG TPA: family 16 glycosylhydrolase [Nocardioidaceae bacterium]|nr:family 16 glycosylhydrolase [Nocardioidaceae bacterium]
MSLRTARRLGAVALAVALPVSLAPATQADHANPPGPVNAQTTYDWGRPAWQDDFVGPRKDIWAVRAGNGSVRNQHGMLTLNTGRSKTTSATLRMKGHETGRWEIRLRQRWYESGHTPYRVRTELIPAGNRDQNCGARNIALESFKLGGNRAHLYIRNLPNLSFNAHTGVALGKDAWHTFAVEVRENRISWFVDGHVLRTERRSAALSGVPLTVRFSMAAQKGQRMNQGRMQMDWLRYFTLRKPNSKSVDAPQTRKSVYRRAC